MIREILRYALKGGTTLSINIIVMMVLVERVGILPEFASLISTTFVIIIGYVLMNRFVFPDAPTKHGTQRAKQATLYYGTIMAGKTANYAVFIALLWLDVWYPVAWVLGAGIVFVGLFSANRYLWHGQVIPT